MASILIHCFQILRTKGLNYVLLLCLLSTWNAVAKDQSELREPASQFFAWLEVGILKDNSDVDWLSFDPYTNWPSRSDPDMNVMVSDSDWLVRYRAQRRLDILNANKEQVVSAQESDAWLKSKYPKLHQKALDFWFSKRQSLLNLLTVRVSALNRSDVWVLQRDYILFDSKIGLQIPTDYSIQFGSMSFYGREFVSFNIAAGSESRRMACSYDLGFFELNENDPSSGRLPTLISSPNQSEKVLVNCVYENGVSLNLMVF